MSIIPKTKFMWLLIVIIAYSYYQDYSNKKKYAQQAAPVTAEDASKGAATSDAKPAAVVQKNDISSSILNKITENETGKVILDALMKKSLEKKYGNSDLNVIAAGAVGEIVMIDTLRGAGATLNCGARAVINYEAFNSHGMKFDSTQIKDEKKPLTILVGGSQAIKGLESGIVGMKEGGHRKITVPAKLAFDSTGFTNNLVGKGEAVTYDVELVEVKDGPYKTTMAVGEVSAVPATGDKILCGDNAKIKYSLLDSSGAAAQDGSGEVEFIVGGGTVPMGFEAAVLGMNVGGKKTVIIPYDLLKAATKNKLPAIKSNENTPAKVSIEVLADVAAKTE